MNAVPSPFRIERAMAEAQAFRAGLLAHDPELAGDPDLILDTMDGETDALDLARRLVRFALAAEGQARAAKERADALAARAKRFRDRSATARGTVLAMMDALGVKRLDDPEFTASRGMGRQSVHVSDADAIPDALVRVERVPDAAAIKQALDAGQDVPGAVLSNSSPTLTVRTR